MSETLLSEHNTVVKHHALRVELQSCVWCNSVLLAQGYVWPSVLNRKYREIRYLVTSFASMLTQKTLILIVPPLAIYWHQYLFRFPMPSFLYTAAVLLLAPSLPLYLRLLSIMYLSVLTNVCFPLFPTQARFSPTARHTLKVSAPQKGRRFLSTLCFLNCLHN
jgi:hypothetical protein